MTATLLTPAQIAAFKRDGFLVVRQLFGVTEMKDISTWTNEVETWAETPGRHMMYFETSLKLSLIHI